MIIIKNIMLLFALLLFFSFASLVSGAEVEKIDLNLEERELAVSFLELSNGEATLIQGANDRNILINCGGQESSSELLERLEMYNVKKIDTLILTNMDEEYNANIKHLDDNIIIGQIVLPESSESSFLNDYEFVDEEMVSIWKKDELHELLPGLFTKVLYVHNGKMNLSFNFEKHHILYMGSVEEEAEEQLTKNGESYDVLKVGDFAKSGTTQNFLERVNPEIAVIFHKDQEAPSSEVMERLNETWIDVYETRQFGNVTIKYEKETYEIFTLHSDED